MARKAAIPRKNPMYFFCMSTKLLFIAEFKKQLFAANGVKFVCTYTQIVWQALKIALYLLGIMSKISPKSR
jgi:hypothetical protein